MDQKVVISESGGRMLAFDARQTYVLVEDQNAALRLEPAVVISEEEFRFLSNVDVQRSIARAREHPEERSTRETRTEN